MKVRWIREHLLGQGRIAKVGEVVDLPPLEAKRKMQMNFAVPADQPPPGQGVRARNADPNASKREE